MPVHGGQDLRLRHGDLLPACPPGARPQQSHPPGPTPPGWRPSGPSSGRSRACTTRKCIIRHRLHDPGGNQPIFSYGLARSPIQAGGVCPCDKPVPSRTSEAVLKRKFRDKTCRPRTASAAVRYELPVNHFRDQPDRYRCSSPGTAVHDLVIQSHRSVIFVSSFPASPSQLTFALR